MSTVGSLLSFSCSVSFKYLNLAKLLLNLFREGNPVSVCGFFLLRQSGNILELLSGYHLRGWALISVGVQLTTGGSRSDALQDLYKSLQEDSGQTIIGDVGSGGLIQ